MAGTVAKAHTPGTRGLRTAWTGPAAIVAVVLVCSGAVTAGSAVSPELASLNAVRGQLGLAPLAQDPVAQRIAGRMAGAARADTMPPALDAQPDCAVCDGFMEQGRSVDPIREYRRLGGRQPIGFALWRAGWTARQNLSVFFRAAALVLDPRARGFAAARTPRGMLVVAVSVDPSARFPRPVLWPDAPVDPRRQLWTAALFPPGQGYPNLYERRGDRDVTVAYPLATGEGAAGARFVAFGLNASLAYARTYSVGTGRIAARVRTRAAPRSFLDKSWTFTSFGAAERHHLLGIVGRSPSSLQRLLRELDGAVKVVGGAGACLIADACAEAVGDRARIGFTGSLDPFVVLHELGHVVFDLALDERGRRSVLAALQRAGWDQYCCINLSEVFADQLAFWALGRVPRGVETYSDLMFLSRAAFGRLLRENAAYRPQPVLGLLRR